MTSFSNLLVPLATKVMLLGTSELGKEVLIARQRLGVETIATDRYGNPPGQEVAQHARTITMSGPALIKALTEKENAIYLFKRSNQNPYCQINSSINS